MLRCLCAFALIWPLVFGPLMAQDQPDTTLQSVLQTLQNDVTNPSRSTVNDVLAALIAADAPNTVPFLLAWSDRNVVQRPSDGAFFFTQEADGNVTLIDIDTGAEVATVSTRDVTQIRPNAGVQREIGAALVAFELTHPEADRRIAALDSAARSPDPDQLPAIRAARAEEEVPAIAARMDRLIALLVARYDQDSATRVAAIDALRGDVSTPARSVLNQLLQTRAEFADSLPDDVNIARIKTLGEDMALTAAYDVLVAANLAPPAPGRNAIRDALRGNIVDGAVGGVPIHDLDNDASRIRAYQALEDAGTVPPLVTEADMADAVSQYVFFDTYLEPDATVTDAVRAAQSSTTTKVALFQFLSLSFDALSLASIFFLAAIGLAITFGVMRVINMAHGEFIMMGAYTGYVVQTIIPNYTASLAVALPLAFAVTFLAGVVMERLVIRHLYTRPLETLLATFGISIALQQLAKNIFGTQARPLTAPDWLAGAIQVNDLVSVAAVRVGIFVMAGMFLLLLLYILNRTRLGLEVRAVTQNPGMAASMGINPDRINMLTFGLGSGIAGVAGVAIGLVAQVTSEMGANYIVQSFMTVVVGGVGSVFGTLAGAALIGALQKGIEWFNPANTLAAQTFMVLFIILFIQFRPKGIVALKGRAAGD
ncbi:MULTISPECIES: urea ABC transporter permease subunit UrtB [unclassified Yoonia]|uniref:urea ABC transporter permease subunit UrtB n=1 Tax=unclassified Yoonia TaxID=2629118 RepID=UPI002AFF35B1|nr:MULTISPECIES: urea ABC transporter permease subunit UrtB [unclassified Yoonia]